LTEYLRSEAARREAILQDKTLSIPPLAPTGDDILLGLLRDYNQPGSSALYQLSEGGAQTAGASDGGLARLVQAMAAHSDHPGLDLVAQSQVPNDPNLHNAIGVALHPS
jgi:hypothetical protein